MSDTLLEYIKSIEGEYEVSIVVKAKYRRLPRFSCKRATRIDEHEREFAAPIHAWIDEFDTNDANPIVTRDLKALIGTVENIGNILCEGEPTGCC